MFLHQTLLPVSTVYTLNRPVSADSGHGSSDVTTLQPCPPDHGVSDNVPSVVSPGQSTIIFSTSDLLNFSICKHNFQEYVHRLIVLKCQRF